MTEDLRGRQRKRRRIGLALLAVLGLLIAVIVPPLVSMSRYKSRITHLMSESLGRPVRLSSVELRLLPVPGFVLTDLTVDEDPSYGAEPVLHANTVSAHIRLLSLWQGRMEISSISVDEASLNVVRTAGGRWNLDPLFRTAARRQTAGDGATSNGIRRVAPLPYLEATNSRINFMRGVEKLPFSLVNTDLSFWQEQPGDWRIRLRGQPARTDLSLDLADTGIVQLEARAQRAAELRQMPVHLDLEWREAQLGQLTRLLIGSDPGWRGDLTGELHMDGTADAAQIRTRLRATGVHRAEFAPAEPLDFDANCGFLYRLSARSVENLTCDSPLGDGHIRLAGELPGKGGQPHMSVELDRIPVAAGLDALRTVRSDFGPGLEATGSVSGKISYAPVAAENIPPEKPDHERNRNKARSSRVSPAAPGPLTGKFTVVGFQLAGDGLNIPIRASMLVLEPLIATTESQISGHPAVSVQPAALEANVTIPAGGTSPLAVTARLALSGYQLTVHGQASVARAREVAHVAGLAEASVLEALAGDLIAVDLRAEGPWLHPADVPFSKPTLSGMTSAAVKKPGDAALGVDMSAPPTSDSLRGTITLHNSNWKADYLASQVEIAQATLHLEDGRLLWDPVVFSYGPVKGTASLEVPAPCETSEPCAPELPTNFMVQFGDLDAGALQAAVLGAHESGTLLSTLLSRMRPSNASAPAWPTLIGTVKADSLILGPVKLHAATAILRIAKNGAEITGLDADLLGGHVHGSGALNMTPDQGKPDYVFDGNFQKLSPADVGQLLGMRWTGKGFDAEGKIELTGFTANDLAASAKGKLHFDWQRGTMTGAGAASGVPVALARFDGWAADADIANGAIMLKDNQVQEGLRKKAINGTLTFGEPPHVSFTTPK